MHNMGNLYESSQITERHGYTTMIAFVIDSIVALIFLAIGISAWRAKEAMGFFTFVDPPKVKDMKGYNHAVAKLWFAAACIFEILSIPFLWLEQNSPLVILFILGTVFLVIAMMIVYTRIEAKYIRDV